jgi:hypothetical protein
MGGSIDRSSHYALLALVWFLWGFFMALGWAVGTWIAGQLIGVRWKVNRG